MTELRLVPAAMAVWLVVVVTTATSSWVWGVVVLVVIVGLAVFVDRGQAVTIGSLSGLGLLLVATAVARARAWQWGTQLYAVAESSGQPSAAGWLQHYAIAGYPASLPVIFEQTQQIPVGTTVWLQGHAIEVSGWGVNRTLFFADRATTSVAPDVLHIMSQTVRETFATTVTEFCTGDAIALIPAMVLGDTSLQTPETKELFISSGLAHLSAVSGANVAIVTTTVMVLFGRFSPTVRVIAAFVALVGYVVIVGSEPSVLRAAVTGIIGMIAMLSATVRSSINALAITVMALLFYDVGLATNFGFALSVAATAGIIAAYPGIYRCISKKTMPDMLARALSIALAAHLVTLPLVAAMSHQVSIVAVIANILAAPVVAPITILGFLAVLFSLLSTDLAGVVLSVIAPLADWIGLVARLSVHLPGATYTFETSLAPLWAILIGLWVVYFLYSGQLRLLVVLTGIALLAPGLSHWPAGGARPIDPATLQTVELSTINEVANHNLDGIELIVIKQPPPKPPMWNKSPPRPKVTPSGIPIAYRLADGRLNITLYDNGRIELEQ